MPDESGKFRGIHVSKVWPGHKDYDPDADLKRDEGDWDEFVKWTEGRNALGRYDLFLQALGKKPKKKHDD